MTYCIETQNLSKSFTAFRSYQDLLLHPFTKKEVPALREVTVSIRKGELFALLGPNGAGKTTLIKILSTLILPSSGKAFVNGWDVTTHGKEVRRTIGYVVSDERSFYWRLTGRQNLRFFAALNNLSAGEAGERVGRLLGIVDLDQDADRMFKDYSTGMRQKLAIARGLLTDPDIIFMDEPTKALDPISAQNIRDMVKEKIIREKKKSVLYATHNLQEAEQLCDRLAIISKGTIKDVGTVAELKKKFQPDARYIIRVRNAGTDLISRIALLPSLQMVSGQEDASNQDGVRFEVVLDASSGNISPIIKKIITMGGDITSLQEKEPSLEEVFSRVVLK